MKTAEAYNTIPLQRIKIDDVTIGLRQIGSGDDLVFIHGFPTHGYTWRKLLPSLSKKFTCHILDLPGLGDSDWTRTTDFKSGTQANYVFKLLQKIEVSNYRIIAHNSGATIARYMAIYQSENVMDLIIFNTEIPDHRPPWIPFYQKIGLLPTVPFFVRKLFAQKWFVKLPMGLKELYTDKSMLDDGLNLDPYLLPVIHSHKKTIGAFKYLKGIDWELVDDFKTLHGKIKANVLFLWGADDKTFPLDLGKKMMGQFTSHCEFVTIKNASLLPHEEKPEAVLQAIFDFLKQR